MSFDEHYAAVSAALDALREAVIAAQADGYRAEGYMGQDWPLDSRLTVTLALADLIDHILAEPK